MNSTDGGFFCFAASPAYDRLIRANGRFSRQGSQCPTTPTASERAPQSRSFVAEQANGCVGQKGPRP